MPAARIARALVGVACVVAAWVSATAVHARPAPQPLFPPVQFERIGLEEGLPQIHVTAITQDARGFVWLGTQAGGLARYDGDRFVHYPTSAAATSLSSQFVTALAADPKGRLWVGTGDGGLNAYDPTTDQFTRYRHADGDEGTPAADAITALAVEADGTLWVGLGTGGVDRFDPATQTFTRVVKAEFSEGAITAIEVDASGQLLVASNGGGVMAVATAKTAPTPAWLPVNETISRNATAVLRDAGGTLWIGTEDAGLYELPAGAAEARAWVTREGDRGSLSSDKITSLYEDRDGGLWVTTQFGLNYVDAKRTKVTRYAPDITYPMRTATYLTFATTAFQDSAGILWFGSLDFGLYKLAPMRRVLPSYVGTPEFGFPSVFCEGPDKTIWAGTYSHGLYAYDFAKETYTAYPELGPTGAPGSVALTQWLTAIHCAKDGRIYLGGSGLGLVWFDPATEQYGQYEVDPEGKTGPAVDRIEHILEGPGGELWLATWGGGLSRFEPKTQTFELVEGSVLPSAFLHRLLFDVTKPGVLWVAAAEGGLTRLDVATRTATSYRGAGVRGAGGQGPTLTKDSLLSLYQQADGVLWIGTDGGGLDRFDPASGKVQNFSQATGLPSDVIYGILRDGANQLWLTTTKGLVRFDAQRHAVVTFTAADGLGSREFAQGGYFTASTGEMYVATLAGFNRFRPEALAPDPFVPPVVLTTFRLFDTEPRLARPIWETPRLELSYRDSMISFGFAALAYTAPGQMHYQFMLEGLHEKWLNLDRPEVSFTNLDPGDYTLKIKAANRHGVWNETPTALRIHVTPPIWRTKWAFGLYIALLIGAVLLVVRWQRERLRRAEREGRLALVENELQLTAAVQTGFLPDHNTIQSASADIVGFYKPADVCSGDWWWHAHLGGTRHLVIVGDVTGHGPGPAMVTAAVATAFQVYQANRADVDVQEMLEVLNGVVLRVAKGKYQMALAALDFDEADGSWTLYSAGAPPMVSLNERGKHRVHFCPGTLLGQDTGEAEYGTLNGTLAPGERVLLFTDGIPEIAMPDGNVMGIRRLAQVYEGTRAVSAVEAAAALVAHAEGVRAGRPQHDDWTFALVEWRGAHAGEL